MSFVCNKRVTYGDTDTYKHYYYTLYSLSVFSLAKSLQFFWEITATYRLICYLLADNWLISITIMSIQVPCDSVFLVISFKAMYDKTIIIDSVFVIFRISQKPHPRCASVRSDTDQTALHSVQFNNHWFAKRLISIRSGVVVPLSLEPWGRARK